MVGFLFECGRQLAHLYNSPYVASHAPDTCSPRVTVDCDSVLAEEKSLSVES